MSDYIVLVKQVPDISQITDNAFDPVSGTLIRSRLISVINELDVQALATANHMRDISGGDGKIICLTMGPPKAEEILRYSLSRCADEVVLLTDRALGGADTWATANPLAFAIRKIAKEILKNENDYYVLSGMQSVDGDTAQVPGQVAEELQIPCVAYVTDSKYKNGRFEFTRIISGGSEVAAVKSKPAVITVAKYEYPMFASFGRSRWAQHVNVIRWGTGDVRASSIGAKGSKTAVIRVFPPGKSSRKCEQVEDVGTLSKLITKCLGENGLKSAARIQDDGSYVLVKNRESLFDRRFEGLEKEIKDYALLVEKLQELGVGEPGDLDEYAKSKLIVESGKRFHKNTLEAMLEGFNLSEPTYNGEVWVVAEIIDGQVHPATYELIGKAKELAKSLEVEAGVLLLGNKIKDMTDPLIWAGADKVYIVENELLEQFDPVVYRKAVSDCIEKHWPQIVLFAATPQGRILAPMVSYRCGCGLTADCTRLDIKDSSRRGEIAILLQTRPALGGNVMATICTKNSKSQMATARPGVMKRLPEDKNRKGKVIRHEVNLSEDDVSLEIIESVKGNGEVSLDADIIVSGGKGMQNRDNYERLIGSLCKILEKNFEKRVEKGATRAAVEQGFAGRIRQVGQTGASVGPKLYVAVGISGAIQHMIGVANTETIVAINSDPHAPIFKQCDYYMVGSAEEILPKLVQSLELH